VHPEHALRRFKHGQVNLEDVLRCLSSSDLIVPLADVAGDQGSLVLLESGGAAYATVYTSVAQFEADRAGARYIVVAGKDLSAMWPPGIGVAVNPGDASSTVALTPNDVAFMGAASESHVSGDVSVGAPALSVPAYLPEILSEVVRAEPKATHGYLFQMHDRASGSRLVAGVELETDADPDQVMPSVVEAVANRMPPGESIDVVHLAGELLRIVRQYVDAVQA
jgi:SseB protein N-terminal domain/SseB protein C-terminal domain